jgi:hypothetical protein
MSNDQVTVSRRTLQELLDMSYQIELEYGYSTEEQKAVDEVREVLK